MDSRIKILAISGSTRARSSNLSILLKVRELLGVGFDVEIFDELSDLPHFNPDLDNDSPPGAVASFRSKLSLVDAVLICTPEYVFSLPGALKNALEWCVSTTLFSHKPVGLITAAASGEKAHEQLKMIMRTIEARFDNESTLLIKGVKGKIDGNGILTDLPTIEKLKDFTTAFQALLPI